jgi:hypothetical protein
MLTIPTTIIIMIFWFWWSNKQKASTTNSALHPAETPPQRKQFFSEWREWIKKAKESGKVDVEQRMEDHSRPYSAHFWHYTPSWPLPDEGDYVNEMDSADEYWS